MKTKALALAAIAAMGLTQLAIAGQPESVVKADGKKTYTGTVAMTAADQKSITVKQGDKTQVFAVDNDTKITGMDNAETTLNALPPGHTVKVHYKVDGADWKADYITLNVKPDPDKPGAGMDENPSRD